MHFLKESVTMILLGALPANIAATPAPAPIPETADASTVDVSLAPLRDRVAIINIYSEASCGGDTAQITAAGDDTPVCHPSGGNSIQVSAAHCYTHVWAGSNCDGSYNPKGIPNSSCYTMPFGSVSIDCR